MSRSRTRRMVLAALMASLIAVAAWVSVPTGEVPVTLQTLVIVLVALVLAPVDAFAAVGVYVLAGAVGLPVFAGGRAGIAVLVGPTGGFLIGFIVGAALGAAVRRALAPWLSARAPRAGVLAADVLAALTVLIVVYVLGWAHIAFVLGAGPVGALTAAVIPFVVPDVIKAVAAVSLAAALRRTGVMDSAI
ncbi:MAG: biotin transporter BioY [Coriobacteriia bacterium]